MKDVVVTKHPAFVEYAKELGVVAGEPTVIAHAVPAVIAGNIVVTSGLPLHLAELAETVTTIPLNLPAELRGQELTIEQMREFAEPPATFKVERVG